LVRWLRAFDGDTLEHLFPFVNIISENLFPVEKEESAQQSIGANSGRV
jgi:hypothetical protein